MKITYTQRICGALFGLAVLLAGCEKEDEMVVDRKVSPVLVVVEGSQFLPDEQVSVSAAFYELDKSGLLDHTVGIDSIPLSGMAIKVLANGAPLVDLSTDNSGKISMLKSWAELGFTAPESGDVVNLEWTGAYKGVSFTKQSRVQVK